MSDKKLLTISEYARHRGCSHEAVRKAIDTGRIPSTIDDRGKRRLIDPEVADKCWEQNTNKSKQIGGDAIRKKLVNNTKSDTKEDPPKEPEDSEYVKELPTHSDSQRRQQYHKAEIARLEHEKIAGNLVDADEVEKTAFDMARKLRERLYTIPDRIAQTLAVETDPAKIYAELIKEIDQVLAKVATE